MCSVITILIHVMLYVFIYYKERIRIPYIFIHPKDFWRLLIFLPERILFLEELYPCCKNLGVPWWRLSPERRCKEHHLVLNISVASKEEGLLKAFLFVSWWKTDNTVRGWGKNEVPRSFSGWLSDIITAGTIPPSLLAGTLPVPLFTPRRLFLSFALSFSHRHESLLPPSYFVSRHCPFQSP